MQVSLEQVLSVITTHHEVKIQNEDQVLFVGPAFVAFEKLSSELLVDEVVSIKALANNKILIKL